jgi:transposase
VAAATLTVEHALCNAHHLRELQAVSEIEHEDWSRTMQTLLRRACHVEHRCRDKQQAPDQRLIDLITRRYDAVPRDEGPRACVASGITFHEGMTALTQKLKKDGTPRAGRPKRRVGHNLAKRLGDHKEAVLRLLTNPDVPFTSNQAQRDGPMLEPRSGSRLKQKISGCCYRQCGPVFFCRCAGVAPGGHQCVAGSSRRTSGFFAAWCE